ncbi:MAG: MCP four helix bundle domain-containing protein, partial [Nitrospira sp.]
MVTWFGNMKTMWKLMLGFAVMGVIMCILGWVAAQGLLSVRENLRIVYEDYTVAATDLARTSTSLARYRNRIDLVLAAVDQTAAEKPRVEIPAIKEAMLTSLGAYAATVLRVSKSGRDEAKDLKAFREALDAYFPVSEEVLGLAAQSWQVRTSAEAAQLSEKAKVYNSKQAFPKFMAANNALDELLKT